MTSLVTLRPIAEDDIDVLLRFFEDPSATGEFEWFGFRTRTARKIRRRWNDDGLTGHESSYLTVAVHDDVAG